MKHRYSTFIYSGSKRWLPAFLLPLMLLGVLLFSCKHEPYVEAPSDLMYSPDTLSILAGTAGISSIPTYKGTQPVTLELTCLPNTGNITMDANGKITSSSTLPAGTYKVSIRAQNAAGTRTFTDRLTIISSPIITFNTHIKPLIKAACTPCHVYASGVNTNYTIYATSKDRVNWILQRVQLPQSNPLYMPLNNPLLTASQIELIKTWKAQGLQQ